MIESFERCASAGADMLAIESTGGKELHDDALIAADLPAAVLALGVLAPATWPSYGIASCRSPTTTA